MVEGNGECAQFCGNCEFNSKYPANIRAKYPVSMIIFISL
jgi:hypothetical protein